MLETAETPFYQVGKTATIGVVAEQLARWLSAVTWKIENRFGVLEHLTNAIR